MIKRLLAVLCLCASAWATTTVSGNIKNLGTSAVSAGTFVRFYLRGCSGNLPRINGTAIIAPTLGNVFYFDFVPNASGAISGTLYSTRDSTGLLGGDIECGGSTTAVWYGFVPFVNGKAGPETPIHAKNTATIDISNISPITTNPVIMAPTGDSTYLRIDAGNSPVTGAVTFNAGLTASALSVFNGGIQVTTIDGSPYLGSSTYPCTTAGIVAANTFLTTAGGSGGIINAQGCHGTITATGPFTLGAGANNPVVLLLDTSTWNMGSNSITLGRNSGIWCYQITLCNFNWTGDVDGIVTPSAATGGYSFIYGLQLTNVNLTSASHAVVHFFDCPQCWIAYTLVSFDSTAASAGVRIETDTNMSQSFGTWWGRIQNLTVQRGAGLARSSTGIIDLDFKGLSGQTDGDVSKWVVEGFHLEGGTIDIQVFCGSSNRFIGGDLQNGAPEINITGTGACASADNYFNLNMNGAGVAGSQGYAIDANSTGNRIVGNDSQNLVANTDVGSSNAKELYTGNSGGNVDLSGGGSGLLINGNTFGFKLTTGANQFSPTNGKIWLVADNTSGQLFISEPDIHGASYGRIETSIDPLVPKTAAALDVGSTLLPWGNLWLGTAATNNFKFQPAATAAARVVSIADPTVATSLPLFGGTGAGHIQTKRIAGCATAASLAATCTTAVTWPTTFADTNYTVSCVGDLITSGVPLNGGLTAKANGSVTFQTVSGTATAAQYTTIDCTATHD